MHALICLVRHGATDWNYDGRAQGLADIPLNLEGKRQAEVVAARLARESWDGLYSSPLKRAMATAEAIGRQTGLGVCPEPGLIERDVTPIEGTTHLERDLRWPGGAYRELPGMESMAAVAVRAAACLQELAARHPGGRLVCVSHGGWIYSFLEAQGFRTGPSPEDRVQRNTSVTYLQWDGERFSQPQTPDFSHLLLDGVEYSGERGRLATALERLKLAEFPPALIHGASAVESAWADSRLVGFVRTFTDAALHGYIDLVALAPGYEQILPALLERLSVRFPTVQFKRIDEGNRVLPATTFQPPLRVQ